MTDASHDSATTDAASSPRPTPLHAMHVALGARLTDFAGWDMPLRYGSALDEHHAVRRSAGIFDLSHMAEIEVVGEGAAAALDHALIGAMSRMSVGRAKYTMMCDEDGFVLDDLVVYRTAEQRFLVVANASNHDVVLHELLVRAERFDARVTDLTFTTALVAVQGPHAERIVAGITDDPIADLGYYRCMPIWWSAGTDTGREALLARTGYTGEDGFELYVPIDEAVALWETLFASSQSQSGADPNEEQPGLVPVGLAARDTLRLEAGMALYGNDLDPTITPFEARAGGLISFTKDAFVGREALEALRDTPHRELVGLRIEGRRPARRGFAVLDRATGETVGDLTSGTRSPTLEVNIALARIEPGAADRELSVDVRGEPEAAEVVELPFHRRS